MSRPDSPGGIHNPRPGPRGPVVLSTSELKTLDSKVNQVPCDPTIELAWIEETLSQVRPQVSVMKSTWGLQMELRSKGHQVDDAHLKALSQQILTTQTTVEYLEARRAILSPEEK